MSVSNIFSSVFGQSPFGKIREHIEIACKCSKKLSDFFMAVFAQNWVEAETIQLYIKKLEEEADSVKKHIRLSLPKSLFLPVFRGDLLKIVAAQDTIANCSKDIAGLVIGRQMYFPEIIRRDFIKHLNCSIRCSTQAMTVINELEVLIESCFNGSEIDIMEKMIDQLEENESHSDCLQIKVRRMIYNLEADLPPVDVMFLYKVVELIGDLSDKAHFVGSNLELILAH